MPSVKDINKKQKKSQINSQITLKDKMIILTEEPDDKTILTYQIDFNTPRTQDAAERTGIDLVDCIMKFIYSLYLLGKNPIFSNLGSITKLQRLIISIIVQKLKSV